MKKYTIIFFAIVLQSLNFSYALEATPELKGKFINDTDLNISDLKIQLNYACIIPSWPQDIDTGGGSFSVSVEKNGEFHLKNRYVCLMPFGSVEYYFVDLINKKTNEVLASSEPGFFQGNIHLKQIEVGRFRILDYSASTGGHHIGIFKFWMGRKFSDNTYVNVHNHVSVNVKENGEIELNTIYTMLREQDFNQELKYSYLFEVGFIISGENAYTVKYSHSDDGKFISTGEIAEIDFVREIELKNRY